MMVNKCSVFSSMKATIEAEFSKTIKDKVFDQFKSKVSPTHTTESPMKSLKSSKLSKDKQEQEEEFTEENRERLGNLLENLNTKCHYLEKVGEKAFNQWRFYSINKEKSNILLSYSLRNIINKNLMSAFHKMKSQKSKAATTVSKKLLNFSNIIHTLNKKIWFEKFRVFSTIKKNQSPFRYVQQLGKMVNALKNIMQRKLMTGLHAIQSVNATHNLRKSEALKRVSVICSNLQKNNLKSLFLSLKGNTFTQKLEKINLTNRLKGRILVGCYKQAPLFSLKNAFLKFRVRTHPFLVKRAIDRFLKF